jgi:RNA polymerase sigma-70 factor (ECF subfamily)
LLAFEHLADFRGESPLSTWLTRIALNEALRRLRQRRPILDVRTIEAIHDPGHASAIVASLQAHEPDPEAATALAELKMVYAGILTEKSRNWRWREQIQSFEVA